MQELYWQPSPVLYTARLFHRKCTHNMNLKHSYILKPYILTYSYHDDKVYSSENDMSGHNMEDDYHYTTDIISEEDNVSNGLSPNHTYIVKGVANGTSSGLDSKIAEQSTYTISSTFNVSLDELYFEISTPDSTKFRSETTVVGQSATSSLHFETDEQSTNAINDTLNASSDVPNLVTPTPKILAINKTFIMNATFPSKRVQDDVKKVLELFVCRCFYS